MGDIKKEIEREINKLTFERSMEQELVSIMYEAIPLHPKAEDCPENECAVCAVRDCPWDDPLHYHHDGCPSCVQAFSLLRELLARAWTIGNHRTATIMAVEEVKDETAWQVASALLDEFLNGVFGRGGPPLAEEEQE